MYKRQAQFRLLFKALEFNKGIKTLSINRKAMDDDEMDCLAEALQDNQSLEVLQMEDNNLGPLSLEFLSKVLNQNYSLSSLSLEGNNLTRNKNSSFESFQNHEHEIMYYDSSEFQTFANSLASNLNLVYLNLANCNLMPKCGRILYKALENNDSLIMVDLSKNPLLDSRDIILSLIHI